MNVIYAGRFKANDVSSINSPGHRKAAEVAINRVQTMVAVKKIWLVR